MAKPWFRAAKNAWYCTLNGKKKALGVQGEANEKEAVAAWHRLMASGKEERAKPKVEPSVKEVIKSFLADANARVGKGTVRNYYDFLTPFSERYGHIKASALTSQQAENYTHKPTWGLTHRHNFLTAIVAAFRWAERSGLIVKNPLCHIRKPATASRGDKALISGDEHAVLLEAAPSYFKPFLVVLRGTGARPSEVANITASNFDADAGLVRLKEHKNASKGKSRTLYLTPEAVAILRELKANGDGVLLRNCWGLKWTKDALVQMFKRLRKRTGIKHATAYGYRHTFATDALANGVPDAMVAELLGHSGTAMLHKHYSHLGSRSQVLREALGKVR